MYYLRNILTRKTIKALVKLSDGTYAIYYTRCTKYGSTLRWRTLTGAENAVKRLVESGTIGRTVLEIYYEE